MDKLFIVLNILVFFFMILSPTCDAQNYERNRPVVIIPGIHSSKMVASINPLKSDLCDCFGTCNLTIWMNLTLLYDDRLFDCFVRAFSVTPDIEKLLSTDTPGFGESNSIDHLGDDPASAIYTDYMAPLSTLLKRSGFRLAHTPYDFRFTPYHFKRSKPLYRNMINLIRHQYHARHGAQKVILVCHSMGCPVTLNFLQHMKPWFKQRYIDRLITLAGAFGGSAQALLGLTYGYDSHLGFSLRNLRKFTQSIRTQPSSYFMLPNPTLYPEDRIVARFAGANFNAQNITAFLTAIGDSAGAEMYNMVRNQYNIHRGPGVPTYCLYGRIDNSTVRFVNVPSREYMETFDENYKSRLVYGDGDGAVEWLSLSACQQWIGNNNGQVVMYREFPGVNHMAILADKNVHQELLNVLDLNN